MARLPRKTQYALEAVLDIAYNARPDPVQSRDVTARLGIPQRYLEQVLQQLVRAGLLKGVRGPRGGYALARERRRITLGDVVRVLDSLDAEDAAEAEGTGSPLGARVLSPVLAEVDALVQAHLDAVTLETLCQQGGKLGVPRAGDPPPADYSI
jgi:Rrf2 family protein